MASRNFRSAKSDFYAKSLRLPLFNMNIAVCISFSSFNSEFEKFIVETSLLMVPDHPEHKFIFIADKTAAEKIPPFSNIEILIIEKISNNALSKMLWFDIKLPALLKKVKADLLLSFQGACASNTFIPQCVFIDDPERTKKAYLRKAQLIVAPTNLIKGKLIEKNGIPGEKITVIHRSSNKMFEPIRVEEKETIKIRYSDSKEFFLFSSFFPTQDDLIVLLKSFSHFKKRQQSNFKLIVFTPISSFFEKSLGSYKYRSDVISIDPNDKRELVLITASAYAVILPFNTHDNLQAALNAMRSGVPVITAKGSVVTEVANEAVLYAETVTAKDIGEKMIQVYTDENYRSKLIEQGKLIAETYTNEKAAEILWQSILKLLK